MKSHLIACSIIVCTVLSAAFSPLAFADERPPAPRLLPDSTLIYVRIASVPDLVERFQQTAMGRMGNDPQVRPLLSQLYGTLAQAYQRIEEVVGLPLNKLLAIPQGEVCLAVVAPEEGDPQLLVLLEVGDHVSDAQQLLDLAEQAMVNQGAERTQERVEDLEITVLDPPGGDNQPLVLLEKDGVVAISSDVALAKQLASVWKGSQEVNTLADNRRFTSIMNRCRGERGDPPQLTWFVDPIEFVQRAGRDNLSAQAGIIATTVLGLDGLQAIGGSVSLASDEFDSLMHTRILLHKPRAGVVKMVALDTGDTTPEDWVPPDATAYVTLHWDFAQTYAELIDLVELFQGEGVWKQNVEEPFAQGMDADLKQDVVDAADGRVTLVIWTQQPPRLNSQAALLAIKLEDVAASRRLFERVLDRTGSDLKQETFRGIRYYRAPTGDVRQDFDDQALRLPDPCLAFLGDYLILTDSAKLLQEAIVTKSDSSRSLSNELDFKLIDSRISRQLGDTKASVVSFSRPEEVLRLFYQMVTSPTMRSRLQTAAENDAGLRVINNALKDNPLPPFAVLAKYLAPSGAIITNDEGGIHYTGFTLRRE